MIQSEMHAAFLTILPKIQTHARIQFREIRCREMRADRVAEVIALAWKWLCRLAQQGKDATTFPMVLADFAVRHVRAGRRLCGQLPPKDVMSERAQQMHSFKVESLPLSTRSSHQSLSTPCGQRLQDTYEERLRENTHTPVPDQVSFRMDFPDWLSTRTYRDCRIIEDMARNERTLDLSKKFGISPGRISQLRREYQDDWNRFCGELPPREACNETAA